MRFKLEKGNMTIFGPSLENLYYKKSLFDHVSYGRLGKITNIRLDLYDTRIDWEFEKGQQPRNYLPKMFRSTGDFIIMDPKLEFSVKEWNEFYQFLNDNYTKLFLEEYWNNFLKLYNVLYEQENIDLSPFLGEQMVLALNSIIDEKLDKFPKILVCDQFRYARRVIQYQPFLDRIFLQLLTYQKKIDQEDILMLQWINLSKINLPLNHFPQTSVLKELRNNMVDMEFKKLFGGKNKEVKKMPIMILDPKKDNIKDQECKLCWSELSESDYPRVIQLQCGCILHLECGFHMIDSLKSNAEKDLLNLKLDCIGCQNEISIRSYGYLYGLKYLTNQYLSNINSF